MTDCMSFPKEPMEFIKGYSFVDSDEVYTNGSELVQLFRVEQMLEHYLNPLKDKQEQGLLIELPCKVGDTVYFISREEIIQVEISGIRIGKTELTLCGTHEEHYGYGIITLSTIEENMYFTRSEAEEALAKMGGK